MLFVFILCAVLLLYYFSSLTFFSVMVLIVGVVLGVFASYILFHSFTQEKTIKFFPGESLILKSSGPGSYVTIKHIGDKTFEDDPLKADLYLTTMGIIAERPDSGTAILYIPHDRVLEYTSYESGIMIRYMDVNYQFSESIIFVDNRNGWINAMGSLYSNRRI